MGIHSSGRIAFWGRMVPRAQCCGGSVPESAYCRGHTVPESQCRGDTQSRAHSVLGAHGSGGIVSCSRAHESRGA